MAAYIDIATADGLLSHRAGWGGLSNAAKDQALELATRYLDALYGKVYIGTIASSTQELLWPRSVTADNYGRAIAAGTVPVAVQEATAEAAFLSATSNELLPITVSSGGTTTSTVPTGAPTEETVKVGSLVTTKKYSAGGTTTATTSGVALATAQGIPLIAVIEGLMNAVTSGKSGTTGSNYRIVRS